jgi:subtilisin family serine protease
LVLQLLAFASPAPSVAAEGRPKLDKASRERLALAIVNGEPELTLLLATHEQASPAVITGLQGLGASVKYHDKELGYVRASIPTANVESASKLSGVRGAEIDELIPLPAPRPEADDAAAAVAPPGPGTPKQNPYMPTRDIGAPQFVAANPRFDGRGVTIGILDTGVDLVHPALTTTTTGERKIVEWVTYTHPTDDGDPTWLIMKTQVDVPASGSFTVGGRTYRGAPAGRYRFATFDEARLGNFSEYDNRAFGVAGCGPDLNRNGRCGDTFGVLWDDRTNIVLVDSNGDFNFADEKPMRPYGRQRTDHDFSGADGPLARFADDDDESFDVGSFGRDDPATPIREAVPFVVQIERPFNAINIGIVSGSHGTHVAGIAAGRAFFGGAYDGAAPGAKIVSVRVCLFVSGCTAHALIEGMIYAVKVAKVDVVNMSIGGLPALNDGNNPRAMIYNELIQKRGVQMFISAGNSGSGINTVGDPSVATKVMSVGAYWSKPTVLANYGATTVSEEALHDFSSRGPREDGFTKPQMIAPGSAVSSVPEWQPDDQCVAYLCPHGYAMFNGTSMAAPQAAGGAALLLSAAKQRGVSAKPAQLRQAIMSSARFIAGYKAHEQGPGLFRVPDAWALLSAEDGIKTVEISSAVPTNTVLSRFLVPPGIGTGIYEREGIAAGESKTRTYTFTRTSPGQGTYNLSFFGDTAAFTASASTITLRKDVPVTLDVTFNGQDEPGVYSALLRLDDPATVGIDYQILNTVVVNNPLSADTGYTQTLTGTAKRFETNDNKLFFDVPSGATALQFTVTRTNGGRVAVTCIDPRGIPLSTGGAAPCGSGFFGPTGSPTRTTTVVNPRAGVWEIAIRASRSSAVPVSSFEVTATAFKAAFTPDSWTNTPTTVGVVAAQNFTVTNHFAAGNLGATGSTFASTRALTPTIAHLATQQHAFTVEGGTSSLTVAITELAASDHSADLDLYVFHCPTPTTCALKGSGTTAAFAETVTIANPTAGLWVALVDAFDVPLGATVYGYTDRFTNAIYGAITITAGSGFAERAADSTFDVTSSGTARSNPGVGRFLRGSVDVRVGRADGPVIGSARVEFRDITP